MYNVYLKIDFADLWLVFACTVIHVHVHVWSIECRGFESHLRQLIFSRKSDYLGCAVLLKFALFVCLTLLASFFLPSHLSFKTCIYMYIVT